MLDRTGESVIDCEAGYARFVYLIKKKYISTFLTLWPYVSRPVRLVPLGFLTGIKIYYKSY